MYIKNVRESKQKWQSRMEITGSQTTLVKSLKKTKKHSNTNTIKKREGDPVWSRKSLYRNVLLGFFSGHVYSDAL
jgi:hypothetical protein